MVKLILLLVILLNFISSIIVVSKEEGNPNNRLFCGVSFLASIWTFANYMTGVLHTPFWLEATYASCTLVVASGLLWVLYIIREKMPARTIFPIASVAFLFSLAAFVPGFIASRYDAIYLGGVFVGHPDVGLYVYVAMFAAVALFMLVLLFVAGWRETDSKRRLRLSYVFWGVFSTLCITLVTNFILPSMSVFNLAALPSIGFLLFLSCAAYSIIRYDVFNVTIVAAELTIFSLWAFTLVQVFALDTPKDQILSLLLLAVSIAVGVQLRRSVISEARNKEELEALALELQTANAEIAEANAELSELSALKSEFLSFATHQLQSPLSAIAGYAEMLGDGSAGPISKKQSEIVASMSEAAAHLSATVEDFLDVSKIEQGGMRYEKENFDLAVLASGVVRSLSRFAELKGLSLSFRKNSTQPIVVFGDSGKLRQAVSNLIDNAIKYTAMGEVRLRLLENDPEQFGHVRLEISDTGIGLTEESLSHLFEKWRRAPDGRMVAEGSGLGLYLAKEIVEAHGGRIGADSPGKGKGSVFYVILPKDGDIFAEKERSHMEYNGRI